MRKGEWNIGKVRSEELRNRISQKLKGIHTSPDTEFKKGCISLMKGRHQTEEHKRKMVNTRMRNNSYKHSEETKSRMSHIMTGRKVTWANKIGDAQRGKPRYSTRGDKHWNWNGGISEEESKIRNSIKYKVWRHDVFKRDWFTCQMPKCGYKGRLIEAHHIKTFEKYPELRFDVDNGITLCKPCHNKTRNKENQYENLFLEILKIGRD